MDVSTQLFSRFGVMFFSDPAVAFANIRRSLKPNGRLVFLCWRPLNQNPWMREPLEAALPLLPPIAPYDPMAPGPFASPTRAVFDQYWPRRSWLGEGQPF